MNTILIASHEFPPGVGGASRFAELIASALSGDGMRVTVLTPHPPRPLGEAPAYQRRVVTVPRISGMAHLAWRRHLLRAFRDERPTAVLATDVMTQRACALLPAAMRHRCAILAHGSEVLANFAEPWPKRLLYTRLYRDGAAIIANSLYTKRLLVEHGVAAEAVHVVHPWLESSWWQRPAHPERVRARFGLTGRRVLLTVGRLSARKGQAAVIRALPQVRRVVPDVAYLVVGVGEQEAALRDLCRECGVEDAVRFAGTVADRETLMDCYDACELYVMLSRQAGRLVEGFGIAFLEAQARAKPVIAGCSGGMSEALRDGVTGLLVSPDQPDTVAEAIVRLFTDQALAGRMGLAARDWVSQTFHPGTASRLSALLSS